MVPFRPRLTPDYFIWLTNEQLMVVSYGTSCRGICFPKRKWIKEDVVEVVVVVDRAEMRLKELFGSGVSYDHLKEEVK